MEINVFLFSRFGFCYEVCSRFLPLQAIHFPQEHLMYHDLNIYETAYPVSVHQKILLFSLRRIPSSERIRSKSSFRYFRNQVYRGDQTFQRELFNTTFAEWSSDYTFI